VEYVKEHGNVEIDDGKTLPSPANIKLWVRRVVYTARGREEARIKRTTMFLYWQKLREAFFYQRNKKYTREEELDVNDVSIQKTVETGIRT
jgi:hypothetical protein